MFPQKSVSSQAKWVRQSSDSSTAIECNEKEYFLTICGQERNFQIVTFPKAKGGRYHLCLNEIKSNAISVFVDGMQLVLSIMMRQVIVVRDN